MNYNPTSLQKLTKAELVEIATKHGIYTDSLSKSAIIDLLSHVEVPTEETKSEETKSEEVPTEETKSEEVPTEETKSEETKSEETKSEETKSEEVPTEETKSEETYDSYEEISDKEEMLLRVRAEIAKRQKDRGVVTSPKAVHQNDAIRNEIARRAAKCGIQGHVTTPANATISLIQEIQRRRAKYSM